MQCTDTLNKAFALQQNNSSSIMSRKVACRGKGRLQKAS